MKNIKTFLSHKANWIDHDLEEGTDIPRLLKGIGGAIFVVFCGLLAAKFF